MTKKEAMAILVNDFTNTLIALDWECDTKDAEMCKALGIKDEKGNTVKATF